MKKVYPVILTPCEGSVAVSVPDLQINTQGKDLTDAIDMARDAIGMWICYEQDENREIPEASGSKDITAGPNDIITLVDIDIDAYRRAHDNRTVRKNLTIPHWLNEIAEKEGVNFSYELQSALKTKLGIHDRL